MAKLHHKSSRENLTGDKPETVLSAIHDFLRTCRIPAILEEGGDLLRLLPNEYAIEIRAGRLWVEAWPDAKSFSRRILAVNNRKPGVLDCCIYRFGGDTGKLSFLDLDRQQIHCRTLNGKRQNFSEQFRRMLFRQFPGWKVEMLSCGMDLQRSFSPVFPRAKVVKGNQVIAAMACPDKSNEGELLTFALLWFHLHTGSARTAQLSLCLFIPDNSGTITAHRMRWLQSPVLRPRIFRFNEHGSAGEVDPQDLGNLQTGISARYVSPYMDDDLRGLLSRLEGLPGVGYCHELSGGISVRVRGLEFARSEQGRLFLGIQDKREISASQFYEIEEFAKHLCSLTAASAEHSEKWLETVVRANLHSIDPGLQLQPVHGQVLTFAGSDRNLLDLLAVSTDGRLTILELKASEDIHLPMQALDYWMRIHWHAERGELRQLFPETTLAPLTPKLVLLAPAIGFHSGNATVLSYFSPQIDVERVGVNSHWRQQFKVVLRLRGASTPISHGRFHADTGLNEYS